MSEFHLTELAQKTHFNRWKKKSQVKPIASKCSTCIGLRRPLDQVAYSPRGKSVVQNLCRKFEIVGNCWLIFNGQNSNSDMLSLNTVPIYLWFILSLPSHIPLALLLNFHQVKGTDSKWYWLGSDSQSVVTFERAQLNGITSPHFDLQIY